MWWLKCCFAAEKQENRKTVRNENVIKINSMRLFFIKIYIYYQIISSQLLKPVPNHFHFDGYGHSLMVHGSCMFSGCCCCYPHGWVAGRPLKVWCMYSHLLYIKILSNDFFPRRRLRIIQIAFILLFSKA